MAVNGVTGINTLSTEQTGIKKLTGNENATKSFSEFLSDAINKTNDLQLQADNIADDFAAGRTDNIHEVMIAAEKADVALQFTMQIRTKILDAYNEIMRMQI